MKTCILIDGNSLLYRMYYGVRPMTNSKGIPTNAVYGFVNVLYKIQNEYKPDYLGVAFDLKEPTFRHKEFADYKAGRDKMPEDLGQQFAMLKELLTAMAVPVITQPGFEADDIIGTLAKTGEDLGVDVSIITGDRDSFQLVDDHIHILYTTTRSGSQFALVDPDYIGEKYGVTPAELIEVKALMGDTSDNIPGIAGIGEKTALKLIAKYHSVDVLYAHTEDLKGKQKERIENGRESAYMSRFLGEINTQAPLSVGYDDLAFAPLFNDAAVTMLRDWEFASILKKVAVSVDGEEGAGEAGGVPTFSVVESARDLTHLYSQLVESPELTIQAYEEEGHLWMAMKIRKQFYYIDKPVIGAAFLSGLLDLPNADEVAVTGHDLKALAHLFSRHGGSLVNYGFDVYIAAYLLAPTDSRYDLKALAARYLDEAILGDEEFLGKGKTRVALSDKKPTEVAAYIVAECDAIAKLQGILADQLAELEMMDLFRNIEMPLIPIMASMEDLGFKIDLAQLSALSVSFEERIDTLTQEIYDLAGQTFNINSTKQLGTILFEELELPPVKKTKTGYSTSVEVLEQLAPFHPIIPKILEYRTIAKLDSTYGKGLIKLVDPVTGKVYSHFNQTVTATGRISSSDPNLQNIPVKTELGREIRRVFVPSSPDRVLLDADYSQIELRVLAHLTGDENLIEAFVENQDIHTRTASEIFGVPMDQVTRRQRGQAKAINFGLIYGKQAFSLGKELGISRGEAQDYIDLYFSRYPKVKAYMDDIVIQAKEQGYVKTLWGRRRYLPELTSRNRMIVQSGERMALNTPIQGSAADIMKIAMIRVANRLEEEDLNSQLILQIHDELIVDTEKSEQDAVMKLLVEEMENAVKLSVPLVVDAHAGGSWYEVK